jgi:hypothetical protein
MTLTLIRYVCSYLSDCDDSGTTQEIQINPGLPFWSLILTSPRDQEPSWLYDFNVRLYNTQRHSMLPRTYHPARHITGPCTLFSVLQSF